MKLRLRPIRVFCFHQVSDTFDESTMKKGDWLSTDAFKQAIEKLQQEDYTFISIPEAKEKLKHNKFRLRKFAVLTADDGWASLKNILPWLDEQRIPVTLFLNPAYLDGKHFREQDSEKYLTEKEVLQLFEQYPLVTIGSHGWEHSDATRQTIDEFSNSVSYSIDYLQKIPNYVPFFAYTWGRHTLATDNLLRMHQVMPVLIDDMMNYSNETIVHRELLK